MAVLLTFLLLFLVLWLFFYSFLPLIERLLKRSAHFTAKFRYRDYLPVVIVLGIGASHSTLMNTHWHEVAGVGRAERFRDSNPEEERRCGE